MSAKTSSLPSSRGRSPRKNYGKYWPHIGQIPFHLSEARFRILICGRQFGKTKCGANEVPHLASADTVGCVVGPTYWHTQRCWREILQVYQDWGVFTEAVKEVHRQERRISLTHGGVIWFKSADNPDSLRSESWDWAWLDECAMIKAEAWHAIEPALYGDAIMTTTPKGHNWVYELFARGQDPEQPSYESWNYPTSANPYYPPDKIDAARKVLPELVFRQEYLGEFIEDIGAVFRHVQSRVRPIPLRPIPGHRYVIGVDVAKTEDFTVLIAINVRSGEVQGYDRFQELDWVFQERRIVNFARRYNNGRILLDSSGLGDPVYDHLKRAQVRVDGYRFTSGTKADLVENLSMMMDNEQITYPELPVLLNELRLYGYEITPSGGVRYRAPEGMHDDAVMALALAAWQLAKPKGAFLG